MGVVIYRGKMKNLGEKLTKMGYRLKLILYNANWYWDSLIDKC